MVMMNAVSAISDGFACRLSKIFFVMASNRSSLEDAGWPSNKPSGFTKEIAGRVLLLMAAKKSVVSLMCAARWAESPMFAVAYDSKLQILQYAAPINTVGSLVPGLCCRATAAL